MLLYCRYVFEKILIILEETMKKTKIICTMGPNTNDRNLIKDLALAGMDIARFNFSHGDHEEQAGRFALIKSVREELNIPIATLLDTKGPEIRTGAVKDGKKVIAVPRLSRYGEHVDDHQMEIVRQFGNMGLIEPCMDPAELSAAYMRAITKHYPPYHSNTARFCADLSEYIDQVGGIQ